MFDAIERGEIKALWVMGTNPAVSLPKAGAVQTALSRLELFVVSENVLSNDTVNAGAQILLPAAAWGEKDGTVTNSERRISRQRAFLPLPEEVRPDWWIISEVAQRMGFAEGFAYRSAADIFREHAALSAFENDGRRDFDLGALTDLSDEAYDALSPVQWPLARGAARVDRRFFSDGGFYTKGRKGQFIAPALPALSMPRTPEFPFRLNTGRIRDQWHTMTRSGMSPRLGGHLPEPFVEISEPDAAKLGLNAGDLAEITTQYGRCVLKVMISPGQRAGSLFVPIHWSGETASSARVGELVTPAVDPFSGQPEAKATPAAIAPVDFRARGFVLTRRPIELPPGTWWSRVATVGGSGYLFATNESAETWAALARTVLSPDSEFAEYADAHRSIYRVASFIDGRFDGCIFVGPADAVPQWDAVRAVFQADTLDEGARRMLLSGRSADGAATGGPIVCACFGIGLTIIRDALASRAAVTVEDIGKALRAGTNCGSCLPELKKIVASERARAPATV